jgi:ribosome-binding factor A
MSDGGFASLAKSTEKMARITRKQKEVAELLRREISNIVLRDLNDPRMGFVAITRVEPAKDFRSAKVYITVRGSDAEMQESLDILNHARGYVQHLIGERLTLRFTPVLEFLKDEELVRARRVERLIDEVREEDKEAGL